MGADVKALTVVNLPFIEERFQPEQVIPYERFEAYIEAARGALGPEAEIPEVDDVIAELTKYGSVSEDMEAELHPDHQPVDPNAMTLARLREEAANLVEKLEAAGADVPAKLRELSEISDRQVSTVDQGAAGDSNE